MLVRIRLGKGPKIIRKREKHRRIALALAAFLTPSAAIAFALGLWRIAADLNWTSRFAIPSGLFSHWQAWLGGAIFLQLCSHLLNRYGRGGDAATS
jgi:hypothetical protein